MPDYGQQTLGIVGSSLQLIASGLSNVRWKVGGITIDWATVTAVGVDTVIGNGTTVKAGQKYIPMGTVLAKITASGKYGPADTSVSDGRQTVGSAQRSNAFLLNEDLVQNPPLGLIQGNASDHPGVFDGGTIWRARLLVGGTNQITMANFLLAFPAIDFADM